MSSQLHLATPRAILFDLDDTLIERAPMVRAHAHSFREHFAPRMRAPHASHSTLGDLLLLADRGGYNAQNRGSEIAAGIRWNDAPSPEEIEAHWEENFWRGAAATAALEATLQELVRREVLLGIVTNGGATVQNSKIDRAGLRSWFSSIVVSKAVDLHKPDPRIFAHALAELGVEAERAWFVGDHPVNDVGGARAAGLHAIWLRGPRSWPDAHPPATHAVDSLAELVPLLDEARVP